MELVLYTLVLIFSIVSIINIGGIGFKVKMNCSFFLILWWGYYFWLKIPFFIYNEPYQSSFLYLSIIVVLVYFVGFLVGTLFKPFKIRAYLKSDYYISHVKNTRVALLFVVLMLIMTSYNYSKYGTLNFLESISSMKENRENVTWGGMSVYVSYFFNAFTKIVALLCITIAVQRKYYFSALVMCLMIMSLSVQGGSKYALLWVLYPVAIYSLLSKPINAILLSLPLLLLICMIPVINIYRDVGELDVDYSYLFSILLHRSDLFNGIYDLVVHVYNKDEYELGLTIYSLFLRFIPREIYPDRLGSSDAFMSKEVYDQDFWIFNFGGIGEFYFNFGIFGVLFIGVVSGYIVKAINYNLIRTVNENKFMFVCLLSSPFWSMPWGIGFNVYFTDLFLFWLFSIPLSFALISIVFKVRVK
ncbi:oligosaccharide repeat unit polymerase [Vibrio alginolyticus]|uniref:O-antigen polymerase n=1 Tax=Vibrio alginolyticus TaxID=663 RepID=UPI001BD315D5|nr:O-antigen polymerase [Vibrio alginolyticus]MBS9950501.1 oligosaccharide repeat unit polymerase [Vibrio alginolyticus]